MEGLRRLPLQDGVESMRYLTELKRSVALEVWLAGVVSGEKWNPELSRQFCKEKYPKYMESSRVADKDMHPTRVTETPGKSTKKTPAVTDSSNAATTANQASMFSTPGASSTPVLPTRRKRRTPTKVSAVSYSMNASAVSVATSSRAGRVLIQLYT
jgi:hypothetical protein